MRTFDYIIVSVKPKSNFYHNYIHSEVEGQIAYIEDAAVGERATVIYVNKDGEEHRLHTSTVVSICSVGNESVIETANTYYTFERINVSDSFVGMKELNVEDVKDGIITYLKIHKNEIPPEEKLIDMAETTIRMVRDYGIRECEARFSVLFGEINKYDK